MPGPAGASDERQLALLVNSAVDYAIVTMGVDGCIQTWNPGAERIHGYTAEEIVGRHFSVFFTEADIAREHPAEELRVAAEHGRYEEEGWRIRKDGSRFWADVVITALRDDDGELVGFGKVSRDLTRHRRSDEQAAEYRRLVLSVRDYAIFMLDPIGNVRSWNAGAEYLKGYSPAEIIGRHFSTFYSDEDRARDHPAYELEVAVREGRYEEEGWRIRKNGSRFWASVTITAVKDDSGELTGFAKVTRDLTERKRAEDALERAVEDLRAANEELDRFASVAAHDMTDPLRTISGFAEYLIETDPLPEQRDKYARHIYDSSLRLTAMLHGLLAYARAGRDPESTARVALAEAIHQVCEDLGAGIAERRAEIVVDLPPESLVEVEPNDLRLILQNLISNAIKFADREDPVVTIAAQRRDGEWSVAVRDNGPGIPAEHQERIFAAFERVPVGRTGGYGLGLAICQRLVERHGGRIGLDSDAGNGTSFWFTLPDRDAPVPV